MASLTTRNGFDEGKYQVLVAIDVAPRGIHVNNVAHVITYDLPRIPRTLFTVWAALAVWGQPDEPQPWSRRRDRRTTFD